MTEFRWAGHHNETILQARGKGDDEIHKRSGIAGLDEDLGEDDHLVRTLAACPVARPHPTAHVERGGHAGAPKADAPRAYGGRFPRVANIVWLSVGTDCAAL